MIRTSSTAAAAAAGRVPENPQWKGFLIGGKRLFWMSGFIEKGCLRPKMAEE